MATASSTRNNFFITCLVALMLLIASMGTAQPMSEIDKLLLLDDALEYAARETRNDATALAKLQDVLVHVDNLLPEIQLKVMQEIADTYRNMALFEVNREAQRAFTQRTPFQTEQLHVDDVLWRKAINAYEDTVAFAHTTAPIEAAKSLEQIAELHFWKGNKQQRARAFFRLRQLLSGVEANSSNDRQALRHLTNFSFQNLVGLYETLSQIERNRLLEAFPGDWEIRAAWALKENQRRENYGESSIESDTRQTPTTDVDAREGSAGISTFTDESSTSSASDTSPNNTVRSILYFGFAGLFLAIAAFLKN